MPSTVHILGAGTPTPTAARFGSAYVVQAGAEYVMFDCGPAATHKLVQAGLKPTSIDNLFFTHHHFDHDVDYPCFLLTRWDQGADRVEQLRVFGPPPTLEITDRIIGERGAFAYDWRARVNAPLSQRVFMNRGGVLPRRPPSVDVAEIGPDQVIQGRDWTVRTSWAKHVQPWLDSLAYRIETADGSVVITGDTEPCAQVIELARGADLLLCMCWDDQEVMESHGEGRGQSGTTAAARIAQTAGVRRLALVHMGPDISLPNPLAKGLRDIKALYDGEVICSQELMAIELTGGRVNAVREAKRASAPVVGDGR